MANEVLIDDHDPQAKIASPHLDLSGQPQSRTSGRRENRVLRVLHVVNGEHYSGAERVQTHLARRLPECGVSVDFACLTPDRFPKQFDVESSQLFDMKMRNRWDIAAARRVAKLARDGNYQLLHAHTPRSAMIAAYASRQARRPWVYHVHSPAAADSTRPIQNRINAMTERFCLLSTAHQITVSNSLRNHTIGQGFDPANVTTVHNGVPAIRPDRSEFPQVGGVWTLGIVALHRPRKGLETLLDAQRIVRDAGLDVRVRCVGPFETPSYEASIRSRVDHLQLGPDVEFTGFVNDIPTALSQLDAMVLPSLFGEGLPMVVLEAMAAAVPVIATRVEGTPEAIRHDMEGLLAEAGNATDLAAQIQRLVCGEVSWHALAEAAAQRHAEEFSDLAMARGVADVYRKVLER
ncbi:N,N'-diacetylbacillosaminyl-diphospho-undecaprenol alpha-1,3-N-acetylgalactosaminyltransferase [Rosistilla carotiformis]|uniref:N, N'-diacetylbacillosaminyl-diphospho-undecaprenol alpha-1,3-N-acetylgalactosaminyltransferase n=1 Tax=Rosistilla carotiformis TaxID=2528017 RepID=A0A518JW18_9BACT|nr:glycosyltransferase [Rosistilla carotiformis]QDV69738.1 N,N'-diacetylbacillosaminyl-diphospho-undecaprenol alpha-1,3-N-acetylgalactosaminyltransferase [Rosistilla carotiformis]